MARYAFPTVPLTAALLLCSALDAGSASEPPPAPITMLQAAHLAERMIPRLGVTEVTLSMLAGVPIYEVSGYAGTNGFVALVDGSRARVLEVRKNGEVEYTWPGVITVGHRGTVAFGPENTIAGLLKAIELGVHLVEIDIRQTSDGHLVLMHDVTVDRTTNGTGPVAEMTLAEVKALDAGSWYSPEFAGESVPTLAEALDAIGGLALPDLDFKAGDPEKLVDVIRDKQLLGKVTLFCGDWDLLRRIIAMEPAFKIRPTIASGPLGLGALIQEFNPPIVNIDWPDVSEDLIRNIHLEGKLAFVNTMGPGDNEFAIKTAIAAGADYIQSDRTDILVAAVRNRGVYAPRLTESAAAEAPESPEPSPAATPPTLVGSTWRFGEYVITFLAEPDAVVKGGELNALFPTGAPGRYSLRDDQVALSVAGQNVYGTYRAGLFELDGETGVRVP